MLRSRGAWFDLQIKCTVTVIRNSERQYDKICRGRPDPCAELKREIRKAIAATHPKIDDMIFDPKGLFGTGGWATYAAGIAGRINAIRAMIEVGEMLGCDMSMERRALAELHAPLRPMFIPMTPVVHTNDHNK